MGTSSFTVEQATRMLPLVRRIVEDVVHYHARWRERVQQFELAALNSSADQPDACADSIQREVQALAAEIDGCLAELASLGVEMKGIAEGLVDFPGELQGRAVALCWKLGEDTVRYYHDHDAGFAGRRPIPTLTRV